MTKSVSVTDEIQQIRARLHELQGQQLAELKSRREQIRAELSAVERQISDISGVPISSSDTARSGPGTERKRAARLPKLVQGSEEYQEIGRKIQTLLAKVPTGLNGKQIAEALGYTHLNERNRIKELLGDNRLFKRTGQGVSTRLFLR